MKKLGLFLIISLSSVLALQASPMELYRIEDGDESDSTISLYSATTPAEQSAAASTFLTRTASGNSTNITINFPISNQIYGHTSIEFYCKIRNEEAISAISTIIGNSFYNNLEIIWYYPYDNPYEICSILIRLKEYNCNQMKYFQDRLLQVEAIAGALRLSRGK